MKTMKLSENDTDIVSRPTCSGTNQEWPNGHRPNPLCNVGKHAINSFVSSTWQNNH